MKILILCAQPGSLSTGGMINSLSTIYAYHFTKWLSKFPDCQISYASAYIKPDDAKLLDEYDFCFSLVNRGIKIMNPLTYTELRKKIKHQIITICASSKIVDKEDILLFIMGKRKHNTMRVYWGADFDLLKPEKPTTINILIDHKYYGNKSSSLFKKDRTNIILKSLLQYKNSGHDIIIKHIGFGKINGVDDNYVPDDFKQSKSMDFREIYPYYNEAHIYVVTHPESFGLTTIECASASALIVQPHGYIKKDIINKLHHVSIFDMQHINWDDIISQINIPKSMQCAKLFSYEKTVNQLYYHMKKFIPNEQSNP